MTRSSQRLSTRASALALRNGWEILETLSHDDELLRQLAVVSGSSRPAELCLRADGGEAQARVSAEIDALRATKSEHVLSLIDVIPLPRPRRPGRAQSSPPALLLEHAPGGHLAALLDRRGTIRAGEAATILSSIATGLDALHRAGWAHGALTTHCVVFRRDGCPAIARLGDACPLASSSLDDDRHAFLRLAQSVTTCVARGEGERMLAAVRTALLSPTWTTVAEAVTSVAEPEAVLLPLDPPRIPPPTTTAAPRPRLGLLLDGHPLADFSTAAREWLRTRKKLVGIASAPLIAAAITLALLPSDPQAEPPSGQAASSSQQASPEKSPAPLGEASSLPSSTPASSSLSDDPIEAASSLLESRRACFASARPTAHCLEASVQADSALFRSDSAALGQPGEAVARDLRGSTLALVQRWGDAALISLSDASDDFGDDRPAHSEPASLLMVRSEAGWRLREVYPS